MKIIKRSLLVLAVLTGLLFLGAQLFFRSSLPPMDGTLKLQNLSHSVKITRDSFGIPHIQATNKLDALRALGFTQASERLFQMEIARRMTQGELSEIFGEVALKSDKLYRSLMLKRSVERMLEQEKAKNQFDSDLWSEMEAYFDGINQFIATQPLPYELTILGFRPRPFTPVDAYVMTGHMAYSFGIALTADPLMSQLASKLPYEHFQALRNDPLNAPLKVSKNISIQPFEIFTEGLGTAFFEGSNAWLIAPSRSTSGKSIFANDPHIGFSSPSIWFEAHIKTPQFEIYGHFLPLVPFPVLGHNRHHAWGFTMSLADDMDLYREKIDSSTKTVLYKNKATPYQEWTETIAIKGKPALVLNMIETPHGPVMDEVLSEKSLALKWAFHSPNNNPMKALRLMSEAKSMSDFETALQYGTAPGLNVMYADADNIAWWIFGDIAVKQNPNSDMILNGSNGQDEYLKVLSWNEKPHIVNPESGYIVTANSRPLDLNKDIRGDWQSDDRFQTITKALREKDLWNIEELKTLQTDNFNYQTKNILEKMLEHIQLTEEEAVTYKDQLQDLKSWNHHSDTDSTAASLYHQWNNENVLLMLADWDDDTRRSYLNTPYAWVFYERAILSPTSAWWTTKNYTKIITMGFKNAAQKVSKTTWGSLHTIQFTHPMGRKFPFNFFLNVGPFPMPGAYNDINNNKMAALGGDFKVVAGPSTRRLIDFANPQLSWGINPLGNSGHLKSPFYKDQVELFIQGQYRPQLMNEIDIVNAKSHELILE